MTIPESAKKVIEHYKALRISKERTVRCPYYRNPRSGKERWGLNAFSGKGSPREIEEELRIIEKLEGRNFATLRDEEVRDIMRKRHLGVECSGFLVHVLDAWVLERRGKRIYQVLTFPHVPFWKKIVVWLRPFTHIDITTLTDSRNSEEFFDWSKIRLGDLIRFNTNIDHAILVTSVGDGRIEYVHSILEGTGVGIKEGVIKHGVWKEEPDTGTTIKDRATKPRLYHPLFLS